jgi:galactose mutarotase-like enzyme
MTTIENDFLRVQIRSQGAELTSIHNKQNDLEYLWQANPLVWAKHSPVLFPIVGSLKNGEYIYDGRAHKLSRHGFARDKVFDLESASIHDASFHLSNLENFQDDFPFPFDLNIRYSIEALSLSVRYTVNNPGNSPLYFSIGAHPAFKVPLMPELKYEDYFLEFSDPENAPRWPITKDGLITESPETFFQNQTVLPLTHELFAKDALVFKGLRSTRISLKSRTDSHGLHFNFKDFPFMGFWAAPNADFVCIEPWCGIADSVNSTQRIEEKEGIIKLDPKGEFVRSWSIGLF